MDRVGPGKARQVNTRFLAMTRHYVVWPEFCIPAAGWDCASVAPPGHPPRITPVKDARPIGDLA